VEVDEVSGPHGEALQGSRHTISKAFQQAGVHETCVP